MGPRFASLHQAQRVSSPSRGLEPSGQSLGPRFASLHQVQRFSSEIRRLAPRNKAWANALPFSSKLSRSPCQVMGLHPRTWPGSTLRISHSCSACLLSESWARCAGLGINLRFATLHQAQRVSLPIRRLAPRDKAWVQVLPLSTRLSVSPCRFAGSHHWTRLGFTFCLSPQVSVCLFAESRARTAGPVLGSRINSLYQVQRVSLPSRGLAP